MEVNENLSEKAQYDYLLVRRAVDKGDQKAYAELMEINTWTGTLPASGEYTIAVFLYRSAARRGETSNFRLDVSVVGATGDVVQNDFADGLAGGPDFLQVSVPGGGTLNLRAGPSAGARISRCRCTWRCSRCTPGVR